MGNFDKWLIQIIISARKSQWPTAQDKMYILEYQSRGIKAGAVRGLLTQYFRGSHYSLPTVELEKNDFF